MKLRNYLNKLSSFLILTLVLLGFGQSVLAAANAVVSFSADKTTANVNDQVKITISTTVNEFTAGAVRVKFDFDVSKLEYVSQDDSNSVYSNSAAFAIAGGSVDIGRATNSSGFSGSNGKVTSLVFKVVGTGSTNFNIKEAKVYELGTGSSKPVTTSNVTLTLNAGTGGGSTPAPSTPTPTPKPTTRTTPRVTATPRSTPIATTAPTVAPSINVSAEQSTVSFSKVVADADGVDTITVTVSTRDPNGSLITTIEPIITGLRDIGDAASPFVYDSASETWSSQITSTEPGLVTVSVSANATQLSKQDLTFNTPVTSATPTPNSTGGGSSFFVIVIVGLILLLLIAGILIFLWRRLRRDDDDDYYDDDLGGPAYPGETPNAPAGTNPPPAGPAPAPEPAPEENANFNPNDALQRGAPAQEQQAPPPPDNTIPL